MGADSAPPQDSNVSASQRRVREVVVGGGLVAALAVFAYFASVLERFPGDHAGSSWVQSWQTGWLDVGMKVVSSAGLEVVAVAIVSVAAVGLYARALKTEAWLIVAAVAAGYALRTALKLAIARPRPPDELVKVVEQADGYAFPSGHVMHYVVFLGALAFFLWPETPPGARRWLLLTAAVLLLALMGFSRVYLGVHWPSDVVGGYAFGGAVLAGVLLAGRRLKSRKQPAPGHETPS